MYSTYYNSHQKGSIGFEEEIVSPWGVQPVSRIESKKKSINKMGIGSPSMGKFEKMSLNSSVRPHNPPHILTSLYAYTLANHVK